MNNKYITVAEFAKRKNLSKYKAYQEIEKEEYKDRIEIINGVKMILMPAFTDEDPAPMKVKQKEENINKAAEHQIENNRISQDFIEYLKQQLKEKDSIIQEKDKQIIELNNRLTMLLEKQQDISQQAIQATQQAQYIHAIDTLPKEKRSFWKRLTRNNKENKEQAY